jgi:hypothetical protein
MTTDETIKTEYLLLVGAACAACETGDTAGLYSVLQLLQYPKGLRSFSAHMALIAKQQAEYAVLKEAHGRSPQ